MSSEAVWANDANPDRMQQEKIRNFIALRLWIKLILSPEFWKMINLPAGQISCMKRLILSALCALPGSICFAQHADLHISLTHSTSAPIDLAIYSRTLSQDVFKKGEFTIPVDKQGSASFTVALNEPVLAALFVHNFDSTGEMHGYTLYLSPGDDLHLTIPLPKGAGVTVSGRGSENNSPDIISLQFGMDMSSFEKDTLPYRAMEAIRQQCRSNDSAVKTFLSTHHPSKDRILNLQNECAYFAPQNYFQFKENNKYAIRAAYQRNLPQWQAIQDSLFATIRLNNDAAFSSNCYRWLIWDFLLREKERLWQAAYTDPEKFSRQWYDTTREAGLKLFEDDKSNLLQEKIIQRNFSGRTAQYLYATLFESAVNSGDPANIVKIFERFSKTYPQSEYISWIRPYIDTIKERQSQTLTDKMIFVGDKDQKLDSFSDVLKLIKGRTVLLDMWGTWCGPCRSEIQTNSQAIKSYFAGKGLDYLYVANYDQGNEAKWKQLIAYFHLEGTHVLANGRLTDDIMKKVSGSGFPTYVIVKKDGSYELSKAGYPMDRQKLIQQLETALAQ